MSKVGKFLSQMLSDRHVVSRAESVGSINDIDSIYENIEPYSLGVYYGESLKRLDRKTIYTEYKTMMQDPTIHASLNLLTASALGGHETRGEVVFIRPVDKILGDGVRAKELRKLVEKEAEYLQSLINPIIFALCRNGIGYGDAYARVYPEHKYGLAHVLCNDTVDPPLIQSFEQAGRTVGYHALEINDFEMRRLAKLTTNQMVRMKMQRVSPLPQFRIDHILHNQLLNEDDLRKVPIIPSAVGGSLLQAVVPAWRDWTLAFSALNSQQIADSVNNQFLSMDLSSVPQAQRAKYKSGLQTAISDLRDKVKKSLSSGENIWDTNYVFLPSWGEKQILNSLGDITKRQSPMSVELAMTHLKRGIGALGLDLSLTGWMELISGGLGDGATFHTSAQVAQTSALIRQAITEPIIDLCIMHFSYKYGKVFKRGDLPFKIDFYSDISASATEALNNKNTRASTMQVTAGALAGIKDLGLDQESTFMLLTDVMGFDDTPALKLAKSLSTGIGSKEVDQEDDL